MKELKLEPNETELIGRWVEKDGSVVKDEACRRIDALLAGGHLTRITQDASGWEILYQDKEDGRFWEMTYPQSHMHGGGPPALRCLNGDEAKKKYNLRG